MWFLKAADSAVQKFYSVKKNPDQIEIFRGEEIFPLKPALLHCIELIQFVMSVSTRLHRQTLWNFYFDGCQFFSGNISPLKLVTSKKSAQNLIVTLHHSPSLISQQSSCKLEQSCGKGQFAERPKDGAFIGGVIY